MQAIVWISGPPGPESFDGHAVLVNSASPRVLGQAFVAAAEDLDAHPTPSS